MCTFVLVTNDDETGTINDGNGSELPVFFCGRATHTLTRTQTEREFTLEKTDSSKTSKIFSHSRACCSGQLGTLLCAAGSPLYGKLPATSSRPFRRTRVPLSRALSLSHQNASLSLSRYFAQPSLSFFFARTVSLIHTQTRARTNTNTRLLRDAFKYVCECVN